MALLMLILPVLILALLGVAVYEHVTSVTLSLPLTPALTFCTILLPLFAAANLLSLRYILPQRKSNRRVVVITSTLAKLLLSPIILQTLQAILATVLATLYFTDLVPNTAVRDCRLATQWQHLFRIKDARSLRAVQDALQCCGFRSVRDMAWPFATPAGASQCAAMFDRTLACRVPWAAALRRSAGVNFGVVVAVAMLQIISLFLATRYGAQQSRFVWNGWSHAQQQQQHHPHHIEEDEQGTHHEAGVSASSRPLLTDYDDDDDDDNNGQTNEPSDWEEGGGGKRRDTSTSRPRYGAIENGGASTTTTTTTTTTNATSPGGNDGEEPGPRLEPSRLNSERDAWRDEFASE
ncbi:hypothetical protein BD289DRAFT_53233 [Coniella lustricola]|uniref:Tetraspanin Tsp3 n=1 Tax=Coniella lustricola TaxID=2025994 RepID=A0A2T3A115_9PEZI|nr:hypothetical protein BD289DRAFT_53233 [Coniella lustricola]